MEGVRHALLSYFFSLRNWNLRVESAFGFYVLGDVASEMGLWQLVEMPREACLDEGAQRGKRVLGSNVPRILISKTRG